MGFFPRLIQGGYCVESGFHWAAPSSFWVLSETAMSQEMDLGISANARETGY